MPYSGVINIYKERGYTSFKVVSSLRSVFNTKKVGHAGTLDPEAEGVLPVCIGKATKCVDLLTDSSKEYRAVLRLGIRTDTEDLTGNILSEAPVNVSGEEVRNAILSFKGEGMQLPPMYSALKKDGKRLYEYARAGVEVERKPRKIKIYDIDIEDISLPEATFTVSCSKGTYIRSLCRDIGEKLGCGGAMASLVRTRHSSFLLEDAITLSEIKDMKERGEDIYSLLTPVDALFRTYTGLILSPGAEKKALNGMALSMTDFISSEENTPETGKYRVYLHDKRFLGLYEKKDDAFRLSAYFYED